MPAAANKNPGDVILAAEWNTLATTANNGESGAAAATTTANAASTAVATKYAKPAQGIPVSDFEAALRSLPIQYVWNGSNYVQPGTGSVCPPSAQRPTGTLRHCFGGPNPLTLGLIGEPGDRWTDVSA